MTKKEILRVVTFGHRIAEEESGELSSYFVQTDQWHRIFNGKIDIIYGAKGSGKSAIYSELLNRREVLLKRRVLVIPAENLRGAPAFKDLIADPPTSEEEFCTLWKIYFLLLAAKVFKDLDVVNSSAVKLISILEDAKLFPKTNSLSSMIKSALDYARALTNVKSYEAGIKIDPMSAQVSGFIGKITLREPGAAKRELGYVSIHDLFDLSNTALKEDNYQLWLALDRLDTAFTDNSVLEENALRALFKVYLDLGQYDRISLKIFLRSDIWQRITKRGFREASHITKHVTITWDKQSLMNLVIRRVLVNEILCKYYKVTASYVLSDYNKQIELFYRIFPDQVDPGSRKSETFDWILSRVADGLRQIAPRELIHLLLSIRQVQLQKLEIGEGEPPDQQLFGRVAIKEALGEVSKVRLEQTIFAEYPQCREFLLKLEREKTQQTPKTLSGIWGLSAEETLKHAYELGEIGFFEIRGSKENPQFWVPFLYRDSLNMIQGAADEQNVLVED